MPKQGNRAQQCAEQGRKKDSILDSKITAGAADQVGPQSRAHIAESSEQRKCGGSMMSKPPAQVRIQRRSNGRHEQAAHQKHRGAKQIAWGKNCGHERRGFRRRTERYDQQFRNSPACQKTSKDKSSAENSDGFNAQQISGVSRVHVEFFYIQLADERDHAGLRKAMTKTKGYSDVKGRMAQDRLRSLQVRRFGSRVIGLVTIGAKEKRPKNEAAHRSRRHEISGSPGKAPAAGVNDPPTQYRRTQHRSAGVAESAQQEYTLPSRGKMARDD